MAVHSSASHTRSSLQRHLGGYCCCQLNPASGSESRSQDVHRVDTFLPSTRMAAFVSGPHLLFGKSHV